MASRLSYFLWSTIPDDELLELARQGKLQDAKVLTQQVDRMLDDPPPGRLGMLRRSSATAPTRTRAHG